MHKNNFANFRTERRSKISIMNTIITNNEELKEAEKDVLLRGYIVLIYAFWEGNYKQIQEIFYQILQEKTVEELPYELKENIVMTVATTSKQRNSQIKEIKLNAINTINTKIGESLKKKVKSLGKHNIKCHFKDISNNPSYDIVNKMLKKYTLNLDKIIKQLIDDGTISKDFRERLQFIITSRNNIAHGEENEIIGGSYINSIKKQFFDEKEVNIVQISEFLSETAFFMDILYNQILDDFINKYMHAEEKMV